MKKTFIIISLFTAWGTASYAGAISQQWIKTSGTSSDDTIYRIQQTRGGGYIAVGNTGTAPGSFNLLVMTLDVNGNAVWLKTYPYGTWPNNAYAIQQVSDGSYIVAGINGNIGFSAGWILNLDGDGDILWQKAYEGVTEFESIQQTTDGGYVAAGPVVVNAQGSTDIVIVKLTSAGNIVWAKQYDLADQGDDIDFLQTDDGGYILTVNATPNDNVDIYVLKLDSNGDSIWQKSYGNADDNAAYSIQQTNDGGYILAGYNCDYDYWHYCNQEAMVLKLNADGEINWQKVYALGDSTVYTLAIEQTVEGGYEAIGATLFGDRYNIILLHLDSSGNIIWQKSYGGPFDGVGIAYAKTIDGGSIIAGNCGMGESNLMLLKMDRNGEIPYCDSVHDAAIEALNGDMTSQNINATVESVSLTVIDTNTIPQDISVDTAVLCYYEDPNDIDGDGVDANPGGEMAGSMYSSSFLAEGDNCSDMPNGPYLGTCTSGKIGSTCIAHAACGVNGFCSMNQEDTLPPQGNDMGDACDCEGNFNCDTDSDVDGSDAALFKADFGRSEIVEPCTGESPCNGDFNCDGDADGSDASLFKSDFGRSSMQNPCPVCESGAAWCSYQ